MLAHVEKISVALTPELVATLHAAVKSGGYASSSEVMREALREWKQRRIERDAAVNTLGALWDAGIESGPPSDADDVFARVRAKLVGRTKE